jgi:phosphocarrier protein HPr
MSGPQPPSRASKSIEIVNRRGLHARAAARLVKLAATFQAEIIVTKDGIEVVATSIMGLLLLAAGPGDTILIEAKGVDASQALYALDELINSKFQEEA